MKEFLKKIVTANTGISSKRVCGCLGWLVAIGVIIYCTITNQQAPEIMETFLWAIMGLLGIDSVTKIWKKHEKEIN